MPAIRENEIMKEPSKSGFSIMEAIISMVLLAIVIAGSYSLIVRSASAIRSARNHYIAVNIAKARIERARNFSYNELYMMGETAVVVDDSGNPLSGGSYRRSTTVTTNYQPGLTRILVNTEIRDWKTKTFKGDAETVAGLFTEYITL